MRTRVILLAAGVAVGAVLTSGCSKAPPPKVEVPPQPVAAPPPPPPAPKPILLGEFTPVTLEAGSQASVELKIERNGNQGPIPVRIESVPAGLTAKAADIPHDQSTGSIELAAAPTLGDKQLAVNLSITAQLGELRSTRQLAVNVPELGLPSFQPAPEVLLQPGTKAGLSLHIQRGRYQGPLEFRIEATPAKVTCDVSNIAAGENSAKLELTAAPDAPNASQPLRLTTTLYGRNLSVEVPVKIDNRPFQVNAFRVVSLAPGQTQKIEVPIERSSYKGPLQLRPEGLPAGVTITSASIAPDQTKAVLEITASADAVARVDSSKIVSTAGHLTRVDPIVIRVASADANYLPPAITANPDNALLKRGSIGGRLTVETKRALLEFYGGTPESEAAVMRGLKWLAAHQQADGSWPLNDYGKGIQGCDCKADAEKEADKPEAAGAAGTAFGVLPFLGAGVTHNRAPRDPPELAEYQDVVLKALVYLAKHQVRGKAKNDKNDGFLGGSMYAHALGTIALCEAYGLSGDERLKVNAQLAIKYLLNAQHEPGGGWRYGPGQAGDMSVTGWVFLAIRSAQLTGIDVLKPPLIRAGRFVDSCAAGPPEAKLSRYAYEPGQPEKLTLTAAGLLTREYLGWKKDEPNLVAGAQYLMQNLPPELESTLGPIYYYYYATQVLHHMEGPSFDLWNHRMREHLIRTQEKTGHKIGSWSPAGTDFGARGGRMYATSMALITLQVYYRHLPMYRHVRLASAE